MCHLIHETHHEGCNHTVRTLDPQHRSYFGLFGDSCVLVGHYEIRHHRHATGPCYVCETAAHQQQQHGYRQKPSGQKHRSNPDFFPPQHYHPLTTFVRAAQQIQTEAIFKQLQLLPSQKQNLNLWEWECEAEALLADVLVRMPGFVDKALLVGVFGWAVGQGLGKRKSKRNGDVEADLKVQGKMIDRLEGMCVEVVLDGEFVAGMRAERSPLDEYREFGRWEGGC
ncbi:Uu.00g094300.m01.CDS01 [Anthostomella pinea]|uniref:Uu.00g094300.m01.CDS01 n=1 Tax=Anthostomella pinea TaxID=933095 RepID=A0AAI8VNL4_9PEZI|nr:Uu.00g094300.m01.CDS01 [Anthostomella pinea]